MKKEEIKELKKDNFKISVLIIFSLSAFLFIPLKKDFGEVLENLANWNFNLMIGLFFTIIISIAFNKNDNEYENKTTVNNGVILIILSFIGLFVSMTDDEHLQIVFIIFHLIIFISAILYAKNILFKLFTKKDKNECE